MDAILLSGAVSIAAGLVVAIAGVLIKRWMRDVKGDLREIHVMVNSRLSEALDRITVLEGALHLAPGEEPQEAELVIVQPLGPEAPAEPEGEEPLEKEST